MKLSARHWNNFGVSGFMVRITKRQATIVLLMAIALVVVFAASAGALENFDKFNQTLNQQQTTVSNGTNIGWEIVKLILILGLILGAAWSVVRLFGQRSAARMQGRWLQVVDEILLDHNRSIVLCKAGNIIYGLGVTDHNISLLFRVDDNKIHQEIEKYLGEETIFPASTYSWKSMVNSIFKPRQANKPGRKEFHWLIEEQARRLDDLAQTNPKDQDRGGRSGDYE